jgi:hypothetical protein
VVADVKLDRGAKQAASLQALLALDDQSAAGLRLNRQGNLCRIHYSAALGTSRKGLSSQSLSLIREWNALLLERYEGISPMVGRFLEVIEEDKASTAGVVATVYRLVDMSHYAQRLGVSVTGLRGPLRDHLPKLNKSLAEGGWLRTPLEKRFSAAIDADKESPDGIVVTARRLIDIPYYATRLGVSVAGLRKAIGGRLSSLNEELSANGALRSPLERQLLALIAGDLTKASKPQLGRGGKLNRRHYAKRLSVSPDHFGKRCREVLDALDQEHGGNSNAEAYLAEMERWLEDHYQRRALPIRDGKVSRTLFQQAFSLPPGSGCMHFPGIRALFAKFDARAAAENYSPALLGIELKLLRDALDNSPDLNRDHLSVNRPVLARRIGIRRDRLKRSPFIEEIRGCEAKVLYRAKRSLIDPYIAGRVFVFGDLIHLWGKRFITTVGQHFAHSFSHAKDKIHIQSRYLALRELLCWIGGSPESVCRALVAAATSGQPFEQSEWELAVFAYREHVILGVRQGLRSTSQADNTLSNTRRVLAHMDPVLPKLESNMPGLKYARAFSAHRPSLAEATSDHGPSSDYIDFTSTMLKQACDRYNVGIGYDEAVGFTKVLATEMERSYDLPSDIGRAILVVLERRLSAIRDAASAIMKRAQTDIVEGEVLAAQGNINGSLFYEQMLAVPKGSVAWNEMTREWFPNPLGLAGHQAEMVRRRAVANLLRFTNAEFDGILPGATNEKAIDRFGSFFNRRIAELGTKSSLASLLNPSKDACGAALTLYLVESGANVSVGRTLEVDCIEPANQPGFKLITGHKARAKGKPIYAELPSDSPAIRAIEWYAQHSARYRAKVDRAEARNLFLIQKGESFKVAPPHWYTSWFKQFASELPTLHSAYVIPSMIRPSVLLKAALENDGRLQMGRAIGQHGQAVTRGYQEKLPIRLLRDQHIRRFQRQFETRVLRDVVLVARDLGISPEEFERRIQELQATGLGTLCADPYSRPGSEGQRCQTIDCWRDCPQMLVVAKVEAIALLQIWKKSLEEARGDWERDHPERWGEVWLPWLCLTEVVQKRMSRGPLLLIWRQAQTRATELVAQPNFVPPRPF